MSARVLIIGLHGVSAHLIRKWKDDVPNLRRLMTHVLQRLGIHMPVFQIPLDQLHYFALTEDRHDHFETVHWLVLGDHGMVPVKRHIDAGTVIHAAAQRHGLSPNWDYQLFLDSTLVRVWTLTSRANQLLVQVFTMPPLAGIGQLITPSLADELRIPPPGRCYGNLIWWCAPGILVFPDYFHVAQPMRGMHGYDPSLPESQGMALVVSPDTGPGEIAQAELIDVCPTLCDLMGLPRYPAQNQGTSFLKR